MPSQQHVRCEPVAQRNQTAGERARDGDGVGLLEVAPQVGFQMDHDRVAPRRRADAS